MQEQLGPLTLEPINQLQLIIYSGASGDFNPIHTIEDEAKKAGLPGVIAHGMLTMGMMGRLFSLYMDQGYIKHFGTRFKGMVFLNDVITILANLTETSDDGRLKKYEVKAENQKNQIVAEGTVHFYCYS